MGDRGAVERIRGLRRRLDRLRRERFERTFERRPHQGELVPGFDMPSLRYSTHSGLAGVTTADWGGGSGESLDDFITMGGDRLVFWHGLSWEKWQLFKTKEFVNYARVEKSKGKVLFLSDLNGFIDFFRYPQTQYEIVRARQDEIESPYRKVHAHDGACSGAAFTDDGTNVVSCGDDQILRRTNVETGQNAGTLIGEELNALDTKGDLVALAYTDKRLALVDHRTRAPVFEFPAVGRRDPGADEIDEIQFFPDGRSVATSALNGECLLFDLRSYNILNTYTSPERESLTSVRFSRSGVILFASTDAMVSNVLAWNTVENGPARILQGGFHRERTNGLAMHDEGKCLMSYSRDETIKFWA